ncbi:MAG: hypothetical protein Q7O12_10070 [Deltaproteobacteria bacterium]|nr:hypothetical protein [Deltaproteobacteria bacterium]
MRAKLNRLVPLLGICILWWGVGSAWGAPIQYKQTMTKILDETQFWGWPDEHETDGRSFTLLTSSLNGSKIGFKVVVSGYDAHTFVANSDGSGIEELTDNFPATIDPVTAAYYKLDATGTRLFFKRPTFGTSFNFYYFDLAANNCKLAVLPKSGETYAIFRPDFRKPFSLTTIGSQVALFFKHDDGYDGVRNNRGIYTAMLDEQATKVMDIDQLPGAQDMNLLDFLGSAAQANQILFTWNQDYDHPPADAMWKVTGPTRVPNEVHTYVWPKQDLYGQIVSADGAKALYYSANPRQLYLVDLASGAKTFINETADLNGYLAPALSPSGNYAFFSTLGHKYTRHNLATGEQRDTWAYWFPESSAVGSDSGVSDITADDRYYFMASKIPEGDLARIHRVDLAPTDFGQTPNISAINFSAPRLVNDGTTRITVTATVSDTQGLPTIDRVRLQYLVDGLEKPVWLVGDPVYYDFVMYDDGTHGGDLVAGDGIYTNNTIRTKPNSNFYEKYPLPRNVGIRIVARDLDRNYVMADTVLTVAKTAGYNPVPALLLLLN